MGRFELKKVGITRGLGMKKLGELGLQTGEKSYNKWARVPTNKGQLKNLGLANPASPMRVLSNLELEWLASCLDQSAEGRN